MQGFIFIQKLYMSVPFVNRFGSSCEYENEITAMKVLEGMFQSAFQYVLV